MRFRIIAYEAVTPTPTHERGSLLERPRWNSSQCSSLNSLGLFFWFQQLFLCLGLKSLLKCFSGLASGRIAQACYCLFAIYLPFTAIYCYLLPSYWRWVGRKATNIFLKHGVGSGHLWIDRIIILRFWLVLLRCRFFWTFRLSQRPAFALHTPWQLRNLTYRDRLQN